jgi:hypothetical protein
VRDDKEVSVTLAFLKSERAVDCLRWGIAFVAVTLAYGVAGWMLLRPTGWQLGVNAPAVEIDLSDPTRFTAVRPTDRETGLPEETKAPSMDAPGTTGDRQDVMREPPPGGAATDKNDGTAPEGAKDGSSDTAEEVAAKDKVDDVTRAQPGTPAEKASETPPGTDAADSGGAGRPIATPPRMIPPDSSTAASIMHAPIDTSVTVNQGKNLLRSAKGVPQFRGVAAPQLKLAPLLAMPKDRTDLFSKKPNPVAGSTQPIAPAAYHSSAQDLAQKPAMGVEGRLARNAIGVVIEQRAALPQAGAPLGVHPLPGAATTHASGAHGPATTPAGAPLAAGTVKPSNGGLSTGATNQHPDQAALASHIASVGGPAIGGTTMIRPASSIAAVGGSAKTMTGVISGTNVRARRP